MTRVILMLLAFLSYPSMTMSQEIIENGTIAEVLGHPSMREDPAVRNILEDPDKHRLQLLLGEVLDEGENPSLRQTGYRIGSSYFYPASTIKLFAAASALELLSEIEDVNASTPIAIWSPEDEQQEPERLDSSNTDSGLITTAHEIGKLFVVSDNRAFNRLYDLVGHERLNTSAERAGLDGVVINHRLAIARTPEQNRISPKIEFGPAGDSVFELEQRTSPLLRDNAGIPGLAVGQAELVGGERLERPKNFLYSNRAELLDLQNALVSILRPDLRQPITGYALTDEDRALLADAMTWLPRECPNPRYDPEEFPDDWAKFMLEGVREVIPPESVRYSNKIGLAYGFTTETAYIEDTRSGRSFFLAGTLYTNENETLNDNVYEYDKTAFPFWRALGRTLARRMLLNANGWDHDAMRLDVPKPIGNLLGEWTVEPESPFTNAIVSFNADVPEGAGLRVEVSVPAGDAWSSWMPIANWGSIPDTSEAPDRWAGGRIAIDELIADEPLDRLRVRAVSFSNQNSELPALHRIDLVLSRHSPSRVLDPAPGKQLQTDTPFRPCEIEGDDEFASRLCSPTSLGMLLAQRGVRPDYDQLISRIHDPEHDLYGVWPRAIQTAYIYGVPGRLHRFADWNEVRTHLRDIGPVAISLRAAKGEVRGMNYDASQGHLIVLTGLTEEGDAIVLDPAFGDEPEARGVYPAHDLSEVWLRRARGTAYVLLHE